MEDAEIVTLSEIEHYTYCARQWALIHLDAVWTDNASTAVGHIVHERVDKAESRSERGMTVVRGLTVWSDRYGLVGRADAVEFRLAHPACPVEHKSGRRALAPTLLQLAAQALCLEEMFGEEVTRGAVWVHGQRRRMEVEVTSGLKNRVVTTAESIRSSRATVTLPEAVFDKRCPDCSLIDECLPGLVSDSRRAQALHRGLFDTGPRSTETDDARTDEHPVRSDARNRTPP